MRAVVQRVTSACVKTGGEKVGSIGKGLLVLLGVGKDDTESDMEYLADKIVNLRIFDDENDKMNMALKDVGGQLLVVSQFTLYGDCRRGNRPSYEKAARPEAAVELYEKFVKRCTENGIKVETGKFQAMMMVELENDGPVTLILDSRKEF